jgi:hypothetical protein
VRLFLSALIGTGGQDAPLWLPVHPSLLFRRPAQVSPGPSPVGYLLQQVQSPQRGDYVTYFLD